MNYLNEIGISYRHLREGEQPEPGEIVIDYTAYFHPTQKLFEKRLAMPHRRSDILYLINHWNRQPDKGWSFYL